MPVIRTSSGTAYNVLITGTELNAGRAGPRVRAEYYYQPAGFAGLRPASSPQQARTISDSTEFIIHEWKIFTRY